jgi:hypothetical protein
MFPDPPENEDRTVFCETCTEWRHPRSSCGRDESHETVPKPVLELMYHGPAGSETFGGGSLNPEARRDHPIAKFNPSSKRSGVLGGTKAIYYLEDEHEPETVIQEWIETNADRLAANEVSTENLTRALGSGTFDTAWKNLKREREFEALETPDRGNRGAQRSPDKECPVCGETVGQLSSHLRNEH